MIPSIRAEARSTRTKGELRRLRDRGKVPGSLYGGGKAGSTPIAVDERELLALLRSHPNAVLDLEMPGETSKPVIVADVQRDSLTNRVLHIDLREIDLNRPVRTHAPLEPVGEAEAEREGGIVQMLLHELEIDCLPSDIPDRIPVDVSDLRPGDSLHVRDLRLPPRVTVRTDPSAVVVTVLATRDTDDAEPEGAEEAAKAGDADKAAAR
ncbi:MAG: 50S ribosomal protein L25 [Thermobacillus sp. ZCTH02-B1]|uniref:50S ribosomal protein L25 n=1 Tax=Thermobacillus sp. ZCTH02-B1 TaxID=1858795 RepID=UPI000B577E9B|nr:50S ribosomal protein L25 [Thermobacillus sp. ZCTH02-B1]OUM95552.1 MAG: 50S ribosomal protein L25 [Thermobacillus sp. ZCTH02-B1]